jgi:hypothetical protein
VLPPKDPLLLSLVFQARASSGAASRRRLALQGVTHWDSGTTSLHAQCPPRPTAEEGESPSTTPTIGRGEEETRRRSLGPYPIVVRNYSPYVIMPAAKHVCGCVRNADLWHNLSTLSVYTAKNANFKSSKSGNLDYLYRFFACLNREKKFPLSIRETFWKFYFPVLAGKFTFKNL